MKCLTNCSNMTIVLLRYDVHVGCYFETKKIYHRTKLAVLMWCKGRNRKKEALLRGIKVTVMQNVS